MRINILLSYLIFFRHNNNNNKLGVMERLKKRFFKLVRHIPSIRKRIETECETIQKQFEEDTLKFGEELGYVVKLPEGK